MIAKRRIEYPLCPNIENIFTPLYINSYQKRIIRDCIGITRLLTYQEEGAFDCQGGRSFWRVDGMRGRDGFIGRKGLGWGFFRTVGPEIRTSGTVPGVFFFDEIDVFILSHH